MSDTKKKKKKNNDPLKMTPSKTKTNKKKVILDDDFLEEKPSNKNEALKKKEKDKNSNENEEKSKKNDNKIVSFLKEYVPYVLFLVLILLFKKYLYAPLYVHGESMYSTLHEGDIMILDIVGYRHSGLKRFDIVVVQTKEELIIKRVIGLPGEVVEYRDNQLYINGKKVEDSYGSNETEDFVAKVPKGKYFVLGDNRQNSLDSRFFGPFSENDILGRTKLVVFPFNRIGNKD